MSGALHRWCISGSHIMRSGALSWVRRRTGLRGCCNSSTKLRSIVIASCDAAQLGRALPLLRSISSLHAVGIEKLDVLRYPDTLAGRQDHGATLQVRPKRLCTRNSTFLEDILGEPTLRLSHAGLPTTFHRARSLLR